MSNRKVSFTTKISLIRKHPIPVGIITFLMAIACFLSLIFGIIFSNIVNSVPPVDYENIIINGQTSRAEIIDIETKENTTINGTHPSVITFKYLNGNLEVTSKVLTLYADRINNIKESDQFDAMFIGKDAILVGFRPLTFPTDILFVPFIPAFLFMIPFILFILAKIVKDVNLYKKGYVVKANLQSLRRQDGLPLVHIGRGVKVQYTFVNSTGKEMNGSSLCLDMYILDHFYPGDIVDIFVSPSNNFHTSIVSPIDSDVNEWGIHY